MPFVFFTWIIIFILYYVVHIVLEGWKVGILAESLVSFAGNSKFYRATHKMQKKKKKKKKKK